MIRHALKEQYHAALGMLSECVEKCPDDLWTDALPAVPEPDRPFFRSYWRIAFHAVYFTHLYLGQDEDAFQPWPDRRPGYFEGMWHKPWDIEPFEFPESADAPAQQEILDYIRYLDTVLDSTIDGLDLEARETGISWYKDMSKLSHELLNLRHLQGHVGQLSELLMARGIDIDWVSKVRGGSG